MKLTLAQCDWLSPGLHGWFCCPSYVTQELVFFYVTIPATTLKQMQLWWEIRVLRYITQQNVLANINFITTRRIFHNDWSSKWFEYRFCLNVEDVDILEPVQAEGRELWILSTAGEDALAKYSWWLQKKEIRAMQYSSSERHIHVPVAVGQH